MRDMSDSHEELQRYGIDNSISKVNKDDLTIIIPVLNEEDGIGNVISEVKEEGYYNILVIDGYSTDRTVHVASTNNVGIIYQHGIGKTGAIQTAIDHVETPYFVVMDGDCTYSPKDIGNFLNHIQEYDEIIGVRTIGRENIPLINRFGNWIINFTFNLLFGSNLIDVCSGMYALKTDFARQLSLKTSGFDVEVEVAAQAASQGRITQVPITYSKRVGQQKLNSFRDGLLIFSTIWKLARRYNPVFLFSSLAALTILPALTVLLYVLVEWAHGIWHSGLALLGVLVVIISLLSITLGIISTLLKRMEQRIIKKM